MMNCTKKKTLQMAIPALREKLREQAVERSARLHRSVARAATVEMAAFPEYDGEVQQERELIDELLYIQCCRASLERAIANGSGKLHWRWVNGETTVLTFKRDHNQMRMRVE